MDSSQLCRGWLEQSHLAKRCGEGDVRGGVSVLQALHDRGSVLRSPIDVEGRPVPAGRAYSPDQEWPQQVQATLTIYHVEASLFKIVPRMLHHPSRHDRVIAHQFPIPDRCVALERVPLQRRDMDEGQIAKELGLLDEGC